MALGLILSSSDVVYTDPGGGTYVASNFVGGATGSATLNSGLSSAITSSGDFCRSYLRSSQQPFGLVSISSSVDGGLYTGPYSTSKAYSIRAWLRFSATTQDRHGGVGIMMRWRPTSFSQQGTDGNFNRTTSGYCIRISGAEADGYAEPDTRTGSLSLATNTIGGSFTGNNDFGGALICSGSYTTDTWYRVRADIIPVGSAGDTINIYTSSAGDVASGQETWELVGSRFVDASANSTAYMDPSTTDLAIGWYAHGFDQVEGGYIDQFEILVQDL